MPKKAETKIRKNIEQSPTTSSERPSKRTRKEVDGATLSSKVAQLNKQDSSSDKDDEKNKAQVIEKKVAKTKTTSKDGDEHNSLRLYWLMKSEPESRIENGHEMKFSFEDLKASKDQITHWDGVRNYEARNHMKRMKVGQDAFFYHSNCKNPGIIGLMKVCKEAYVDHTQFDSKDAHYDPKSEKTNPKWFMVDVKYARDLKRFIPLSELKSYHLMHKKDGGALSNLSLFTRSRLSVQAINEQEWNFILDLENKPALVK
jgi:predicted RNA-binding protein with PUA-like domain